MKKGAEDRRPCQTQPTILNLQLSVRERNFGSTYNCRPSGIFIRSGPFPTARAAHRFLIARRRSQISSTKFPRLPSLYGGREHPTIELPLGYSCNMSAGHEDTDNQHQSVRQFSVIQQAGVDHPPEPIQVSVYGPCGYVVLHLPASLLKNCPLRFTRLALDGMGRQGDCWSGREAQSDRPDWPRWNQEDVCAFCYPPPG
jgi:hypothetical protein